MNLIHGLKGLDKNNPFVNKLRDEALSCLSDPEKIKGTGLDRVASHPKIIAGLKGKPFDFTKVWNQYFSSHSIAFNNGFSRNMDQSDFEDRIYRGEQIWNIRCGSNRLKKCVSEHAQSHASGFMNDAQIYRALIRSHAKVKRGEKLVGSRACLLS